jgi:maltose/moltooligosaccharide transporter
MSASEKPSLKLSQIINMSIGFLGIQFGFALQNGHASRMMTNLGADVHQLSLFWLVAPFTGLLVQPIIGHFGDQTWNKLGRRKPYFLVGAILASLGLIFLPNSSLIAGESLSAIEFLGINGILWIAVLFFALMDASFNISMEPFRALVGDMLPKKQAALGFSVQAIIIGIGAVIGSWMPGILHDYFGLANEAAAGQIPANVVWSFYVGAAILMGTILYTIITTKEYPPEEFEKYAKEDVEEEVNSRGLLQILDDAKAMPMRMRRLGTVQFFSWFALFTMWSYTSIGVTRNSKDVFATPENYNTMIQKLETHPMLGYSKEDSAKRRNYLSEIKQQKPEENGNYYISQGVAAYVAHNLLVSEDSLYRALISDLKITDDEHNKTEIATLTKQSKDPNSTVSFAYLSAYMSKHRIRDSNYLTVLEAKRINHEHSEGGDLVGNIFGYYNLFAVGFALLLSLMVRKTSRKFVHAIALLSGGLGLISLYFFTSPNLMILSMVGVGFAWASILSMPYALLVDALPLKKMGVYMGIFNFFIVFPQIVSGILGGLIVGQIFGGQAIYYVVVGGVFLIIAAFFTLRIKEPLFTSKTKAI